MTDLEQRLYLMLRRLVNSCQQLDPSCGYVPCEPEATLLGDAETLVEEVRMIEAIRKGKAC